MIKYVIQGKKNPQTKAIRYYAQIAPSTPLTLAQIVKRIEKRCSISSSDVKAVLDALQYEVIESLQNGNSVRLGDLGSFRLTIQSHGTVTAADAKRAGAGLIKRANVQFTKSGEMTRAFQLDSLRFTIQPDIRNATDEEQDQAEEE